MTKTTKADHPPATDAVAGERLRLFVERIEKLEEDKKAVSEDIKEVYGELKGEGYDAKIVRQVIRERKKEPHDRAEQLALFDLYMTAIGEETSMKEKLQAALH